MHRTLLLAVVSIQLLVVVLLTLHIRDVGAQVIDERVRDQLVLSRVSRLVVQSSTQLHPLRSYDDALHASILLDDLVARHGGCLRAGRHLRLDPAKIARVQEKAREQMTIVHTCLSGYVDSMVPPRTSPPPTGPDEPRASRGSTPPPGETSAVTDL